MVKRFTTVLIFIKLLFGLSFADYIDLNGNDWIATSFNQSLIARAVVPGSIYSDLRREGILKEDLYYGYNDMNYRWVAYDNWTYTKSFNILAKDLNRNRVELVLHGIDTVSNVYVNEELVGSTDNMFIRYKFDVKNILREGLNDVRIQFTSATKAAQKSYTDFYNKYHYDVWPDCPNKVYNGECHYNFIRKMASSFSWDWGPAFPTQGIWKNIGIEAVDNPIIRDITTETTFDTSRNAWQLNLTLYLEAVNPDMFDANILVKLDSNTLYDNKLHIKPENDNTVKVNLILLMNNITISPWFPNGFANDKQTLYKLSVQLFETKTLKTDYKTVKIGFREIKLIQTPVSPEGLTFYFTLNNLKFYAKGSNWIPANILIENISKDYLRHLLVSAKESNINMLRVWGGGIYESDYFYELADELGIMIWQDMMFACALYPADPNFLKSVDKEIQTQVRRLQHHPSIAIWSGNNENEGIVVNAKANASLYRDDYRKLYGKQIRNGILAIDRSRAYVGSSPSNGLETEKEDWIASNPYDNRFGDLHFYDYSKNLWDWKIYPSTRFASEYGFESYPSLEALSQVLSDSELTYPISAALEHHQHHPGGTDQIEKMNERYFKMPSKGGKDRLNDFVYLSQITQAMAMKTETEFYRRNREINAKNGEGFTMGALYWQLNDIWQGPSWASIEFGGKWKLLQSYARNYLNNQLISPFEDENQTLKVTFVRDDYMGQLSFNLSVQVFQWSSTVPTFVDNQIVSTDSFSANIVYIRSIPDILENSKCADRSQCVLFVKIENKAQNLSAENFMLLSEPKNSKIIEPNLKLIDVKQRKNNGNDYIYDITLSSEAVAPFVAMDFKMNSGIVAHFPDNGFFIFNNQKKFELISKQNLSVDKIKDNLTFKTLTDIITQ